MSIFGGSPKVDERRRRRLAAEAERARGRASSQRGSSRGNAKAGGQLPFSFTEIVPASPFKILLGTLAGLICSALIPTLGFYDSTVTQYTGPAISWLFSLTSHPFANWYGSLLLFLSAQLCLLMYWARSRSITDFRGSFRLWRTATFVLLFYSFMLTNRGHLVWSKTLLHFWPEKFKGHETWSWLIPAVVLGYWISRQVLADMRDCLASRALLFMGLICHLVTVADAFDQRVIFSSWTPRFLETVRLELLLSGQTLIFGALWLHARYVLYISVEPPIEDFYRLGIIGRIVSLFTALLALVGIGGDAKAAAKRKAKKAADAKKKKAEQEEVEEESEEEDEEEAADEELSEEEELERATRPDNGKNYRFDPPQNANRGPHQQNERNDLRGMSKKERRRMMQQQRDEERNG
ncbi:MAG: hypothetical protein U0903_04365 [Planctomycetales bacterium]